MTKKKNEIEETVADQPDDNQVTPDLDSLPGKMEAPSHAGGFNPWERMPILVVDDETGITDTLRRYFTLEGYDVLTANNPYSALRMIHQENILVVICDIAMPGMNGVELLQRIKQYNGMIQVIMITGYVTLDNILSCLKLGADDCFIKPLVDLEKLRNAVDEAVCKLRKWHDLMLEITKGK